MHVLIERVSSLSGYQLMTLSRDRTLRVWPISDQLSSQLGAVSLEIMESSWEEGTVMEASLSSLAENETTFTEVQVLYIILYCTYSGIVYIWRIGNFVLKPPKNTTYLHEVTNGALSQ